MQSEDALSSQIVHLPTRVYGHKMPPLWRPNGFAYKDMCVFSFQLSGPGQCSLEILFSVAVQSVTSPLRYLTMLQYNVTKSSSANITHTAHVTLAIIMMERPNIPRHLC